ncbi:hypothetical protein HQ29_02905 [Porphyromonas canoris]|nr:hypothetical protein HQ29_02905 [Porphyromonas canoris]
MKVEDSLSCCLYYLLAWMSLSGERNHFFKSSQNYDKKEAPLQFRLKNKSLQKEEYFGKTTAGFLSFWELENGETERLFLYIPSR